MKHRLENFNTYSYSLTVSYFLNSRNCYRLFVSLITNFCFTPHNIFQLVDDSLTVNHTHTVFGRHYFCSAVMSFSL